MPNPAAQRTTARCPAPSAKTPPQDRPPVLFPASSEGWDACVARCCHSPAGATVRVVAEGRL